MCGIAGGTAFNGETIVKALRLMDHRGKDSDDMWYCYDPYMWFGHNRLAIQDLSSESNQPYQFGDCTLVYNGELWKRTLTNYGHGAVSDTKLLASMYKRYGDELLDFANRLDGMFAFAIYDAERGRTVLARDRWGRMPLYTLTTPNGWAFASEAKVLVEVFGARFAGNGQRDQARSEVKLFPPGSIAVFDHRSSSNAPHRQWFASPDIYQGEVGELDSDGGGLGYYASCLRDTLTKAVINESVADVPICTILSGGVDSTIITAILARQRPDLVAYTVSVGPSNGKDDLAYARKAAAAIGVPLREVILDRAEVEASMAEAVYAVEDYRWVQVAPAVPQIALARRIGADGFKVVFGGEGSDELFASYGDVRRWSWQPQQYHDARVRLMSRLHDNNLIRGNKAMMWGGTVELRTPFLDVDMVDFCLRIPTRYRSDRDGQGHIMKPVLREAFRGWVPDELLMRKKVTFQEGAHSLFLKESKELMKTVFTERFCSARRASRTE